MQSQPVHTQNYIKLVMNLESSTGNSYTLCQPEHTDPGGLILELQTQQTQQAKSYWILNSYIYTNELIDPGFEP